MLVVGLFRAFYDNRAVWASTDKAALSKGGWIETAGLKTEGIGFNNKAANEVCSTNLVVNTACSVVNYLYTARVYRQE